MKKIVIFPVLLVVVVFCVFRLTFINGQQKENEVIPMKAQLVVPEPDAEQQQQLQQLFHDHPEPLPGEPDRCLYSKEFRLIFEKFDKKIGLAHHNYFRDASAQMCKDDEKHNLFGNLPHDSKVLRSDAAFKSELERVSRENWEKGPYHYVVVSGQFWSDLSAYMMMRIEQHTQNGKLSFFGLLPWANYRLDMIAWSWFCSAALIIATVLMNSFFNVDTSTRVDFQQLQPQQQHKILTQSGNRAKNAVSKSVPRLGRSFTNDINLFLNNTFYFQIQSARNAVAIIILVGWTFHILITVFTIYDNIGALTAYSGLSLLVSVFVPFIPVSASSIVQIVGVFFVLMFWPAFWDVLCQGISISASSVVSLFGKSDKRRKFLMESTRESNIVVVPDHNVYESMDGEILITEERNNNFREVYEEVLKRQGY